MRVRAVCPSPVIARGARHNVIHNVPQKPHTTSTQRHTQRRHNVIHNVDTTFPGPIPEDEQGSEDRGGVAESGELLFLHISDRFCLCTPFSSLFRGSWARSAGAGLARGARHNVIHNVPRTPHTTSTQRHTQRRHNVIHNVDTTLPGSMRADSRVRAGF